MLAKTLVVIAGPTAIGKTALAIEVAKHFKTEIISADSRQFFREMEIGTAKPTVEELKLVKHHFINSHSVTEAFSVGDFEKQALATIESIFLSHDVAVLVGGSGLYVKAITDGFDNLPKADPTIRQELNNLFEEQGIVALQEKLKDLDREYYQEVDINNPQRIIRALEVVLATGKAFSSFRSHQQKLRPFNILKIGLNTEREQLYERINLRVDQMISAGLADEVRALVPYRDFNALNTVGYSEIFDFIDGRKSLQQAIDDIKQNTRRFAKRQLTWFRKDADMKWFEPYQYEEIISYIEENVKSRFSKA